MKSFSLSLIILTVFFLKNGESARLLNNKNTRGYEVKAIAIIKGRYDDSKISGIVTFTQTISKRKSSPISVAVNLTGFPVSLNKRHGLHIHWSSIESSSDDPLEFCSKTGPHFNPTNETHGDFSSSKSRHLGDYGNVESKDGAIVASLEDETNKLFGPNSIIGRSLVLHKDEDDLGLIGDKGSKTSGNSGPRIACGVIGHIFTPEDQQRAFEMNNMMTKIRDSKKMKNQDRSSNEKKADKYSSNNYNNGYGNSDDGYYSNSKSYKKKKDDNENIDDGYNSNSKHYQKENDGYENENIDDGYNSNSKPYQKENDGYENENTDDGYKSNSKPYQKKKDDNENIDDGYSNSNSNDSLTYLKKSSKKVDSRSNIDKIRTLLYEMHKKKQLATQNKNKAMAYSIKN